jgi:GNAT superfamily N-acetyltransferase
VLNDDRRPRADDPAGPPVLDMRAVDLTEPAVAELLDEYFAMRARTWPADRGSYRVTRPDPTAFTPPAGVFLLASDEVGPAGCGGIRLLDAERAEVKHLYLRERARGTGSGRRLLADLERQAVVLGARVAVLDTNASLVAAQGLYRSSGYHEIPAYNDNPNATHWFAKDLAD